MWTPKTQNPLLFKGQQYNGKMTVSSINGDGNTEQTHAKTITLDPYLTSYTKIHSKGIKGLDLKPETIKLLRENTDVKLLAIGLGDDCFLDLTPKAKAKQHKIK